MLCAPFVAKAPPSRGAFPPERQAPLAVPGTKCSQVGLMSDPNPLFLKTKLCKFFAVGACSKGSGCKFAHGAGELSELPDFTKTQLCSSFLFFRACTAPGCAFAHSPRELRPRAAGRTEVLPAGAEPGAPRPSKKPLRRDGRRARRSAGQAAQGEQEPCVPQKEVVLQALPLLLADVLRSGCGDSWADQSEDLESPTCQRSPWSRQTTAGLAHSSVPDGQGSETVELASGDDVDVDTGPPRAHTLEVRNTFLTIVDDDEARTPLRRIRSAPALSCCRP
ncbi:unnamed protein product [Prorocentrum cordatum]|uniref:C3H1-type domain-containing protein n=1 Tax=Prorocentrum cordatum TaxID=2364126 RepID=A0ABN9RLD4_9DINO|nr:unnamed protein product [Polarella glacialis]